MRYAASLLARLSDDEPENQALEAEPFLHSRSEWERSMLADVELLLNTKRASVEVPDEYKLTSESLVNYGVPDCTGRSARSLPDQIALRSAIATALRLFETRLAAIDVSDPQPDGTMTLMFEVDARVRLDPETEPIRFKTVLRTDHPQFLVKRD